MKLFKRFAKITSLVTVMSIFLTGCSSGGSNGKTASSGEKVKLEMWLTPQWKGVMDASEEGADYDSFFKKAAEEYNKKNPNVEISVQVIPGEQRSDKLSVAIQTKTLPDLFFDSSFALSEYAHMGALAPLDDIIDKDSKKDISENIWENVKINDKTYFYPFAHNPGTLVYNADMFKNAGLEKYIGDENEIKTWTVDEYKTILETLKKKNPGVTPMGLYAKNNQGDTWNMAYMRMFGNEFFNKDGKVVVNEESGVKALSFIDELNKNKLTTNGAETLTSNDVNAMFQNEQVAVSFTNAVLYKGMKDDMANGKTKEIDARLANIPGEKEPLSFTYVMAGVAFNTGDEAKMKAAKDFIKFYSTDKELIKASKNALPVRESLTSELKAELPYLESYNENSKYLYNFSNNSPGYAEIRNALFPELQAVITGEKTPKEAASSFTEQANKIIEKNSKSSVILNK